MLKFDVISVLVCQQSRAFTVKIKDKKAIKKEAVERLHSSVHAVKSGLWRSFFAENVDWVFHLRKLCVYLRVQVIVLLKSNQKILLVQIFLPKYIARSPFFVVCLAASRKHRRSIRE